MKVILILCSVFSIAFAQTFYEIDANYKLGISELGLGTAPGFALSIYPSKKLGFSAGIEYSSRQKTKTSEQSGENPIAQDDEGHPFIFKYSIEKYKEILSAKVLQVPLLFKYRNESYYASAGLKIGAPVKINAEISYENFKTEGCYPEFNGCITTPHFKGFGEQNDSSFAMKINSKTMFMLAFEYGMVMSLSDNINILAGIYADYSLNKGISRKSAPIVERVEIEDEVVLKMNDYWKSWRPWSIGIELKVAFGFNMGGEKPPEPVPDSTAVEAPPERDHRIVVEAEVPPPPVAIEVAKEPGPVIPPAVESEFEIPPLPDFLLNRKADYVFNYPETRTSPSDSMHLDLISQIAIVLNANPNYQLHCVGYSEKLASEIIAYEAALQRSLRIKYTLSRFFGINSNRLFTYSQGSRDAGYRRAECYLSTFTP